jgi:hypothetical protein
MDVIGFLRVSVGSSTVQLYDSIGIRRASACSESDFSSQNDDHAWGVYHRRTAFSCAFFFFCGQKYSMQRIFIKKCFLFTEERFCRVKRFHHGGKYFANKEVETQVRKWLKQQSKDFYSPGFDALEKRQMRQMYQCCMSRNKCFFFPSSNITCYTFYIPFVTYLLTLPCT